MAVWDDLVGQERVQRAAGAAARDADALRHRRRRRGPPPPEASKMTHAWLFTGPARLRAGHRGAGLRRRAAVREPRPGPRREPGLRVLRRLPHRPGRHARRRRRWSAPDLLSIGVKETRDLVRRAQLSPAGGRWQVIVLEDADRLTEGAGNVAAEGRGGARPPHGVAAVRAVPGGRAADDPLALPAPRPCVRRRSTPSPTCSSGGTASSPTAAAAAARATQGHIGRARRLATDERARARRAAVLKLPLRVDDVGGCLKAAQELVDAAAEDAKQVAEEVDTKETEELKAALGAAAGRPDAARHGGRDEGAGGQAEAPQTRTQRDSLDLALTDLTGFYRDVLALQLGSRRRDRQRRGTGRPGPDRPGVGTPRATLRRIEAIVACREALDRECGAAAGGRGDDDGAARGLTSGQAAVRGHRGSGHAGCSGIGSGTA